MSRLVPDAPAVVVRRGWRRGLPIGVLYLAAAAVVHARLLPATDRLGEAGDRALERWMLACVLTGAGTAVVWAGACLRVEPGGNRWVPPPRRSGWLPLPDPATGCLPLVLVGIALVLAAVVEVLAVVGPLDAFLLAGVTLFLHLVGATVALVLVGWLMMPGVGIAAGLFRRGEPDGDGGPTGPLLIASGVASYAGLLLVLTLLARLLGLPPVGAWLVVAPALAVVLVGAIVTRVVLGRSARPGAPDRHDATADSGASGR